MIDGILLTMVDFRTNYAKDIALKLRETYGTTFIWLRLTGKSKKSFTVIFMNQTPQYRRNS